MYLDYHNLSRDPFSASPDPDFLFLSPSHKEALGSLLFCIENKLGFAVLTGEVGTGKTTIIRYYLTHCNRDKVVPVYIFNPCLSFPEMLRTILEELGVVPSELEGRNPFRVLQQNLLSHAKDGKTVTLLIDEAQNVPLKTLEQLRMLSNFETSRKKLLQIILIGQPELERLLNRRNLRQLKQRIAVRAVITVLTPSETRAYIAHRTAIAGRDISELFSEKAVRTIIRYAHGTPRTVNILCANALIACVGYGRHQVDGKMIREVLRDLDMPGTLSFRSFPLRFGLTSIATILLGMASAYGVHHVLTTPGSNIRAAIPSSTTPPPQADRALPAMPPDPGRMTKAPPTGDLKNKIEQYKSSPPRTVAKQTIERPPRNKPRTVHAPPKKKVKSARKPRTATPVVLRRVKRGDYLSKISLEVYGDASQSSLTKLRQANPQIKDPDLIYEGDVLRFPQ